MAKLAQKTFDAALKLANVPPNVTQTKTKDGKPSYKITPGQSAISRAVGLFCRLICLNEDTISGPQYGQLISIVVAHAGDNLDSIDWAIGLVELLTEDREDLDDEKAATLQSLIVEAVKAELAATSGAKAGDPARNHPGRVSE